MSDDDPYELLSDLIRSAVERDPSLAPLGEAMSLVFQARKQPHPFTRRLLDDMIQIVFDHEAKAPCRWEWSGDGTRKAGGLAFTVFDAEGKQVFEMSGAFAVVPTVEHCLITALIEHDVQVRARLLRLNGEMAELQRRLGLDGSTGNKADIGSQTR